MKSFTNTKLHYLISVFLIIFATHTFANSVVLKAHGDVFPSYPNVQYPPDPKALATVKKGEYLAKMGDCIACHTNTKGNGKAFAGGLPFATPFGTFYSPNITPDKATGIGAWSDADFVRAVHEGLNPKGENYFPVFPYVYFNRLTTEDILAIRAYLNAIPAVNQTNKKNDVPFPLNQRFLQGGWKVLFFDYHKGTFQADPKQSAEWNRGSYIVNGLGHCSMCHTPLNPFGAAKTNDFLGGAMVDGFYAPNITSTVVGHLPIEEIVQVFSKEKMLDNAGEVEGPMKEVDHDSLRFLTPADLHSIAVYLKTVPPVAIRKVKIRGNDAEVGKQLYQKTCSVCHQTGSAGAPIFGNIDAWKPRIALGMDALYHNAINGINSMPPKGTCMTCTDQQIKDAVDYIVNNSKPGSHAEAKIVRTAPPPIDTSLTKGKKVYTQHCDACHANAYPKIGDKKAWQPLIDTGMDQLFLHTLHGTAKMPVNGGCPTCTTEDIEAAVKYMVAESSDGNYTLW